MPQIKMQGREFDINGGRRSDATVPANNFRISAAGLRPRSVITITLEGMRTPLYTAAVDGAGGIVELRATNNTRARALLDQLGTAAFDGPPPWRLVIDSHTLLISVA